MNSLSTTIKNLVKRDYPEHYQEIIPRLAKTMGMTALTDDKRSGFSKFGGTPIIEDDFEWPTFNGRPLSFLAQIKLEELLPISDASFLPKSGFIYFFMLTDLNSEYPGLSGQFQVIYRKKGLNVGACQPPPDSNLMVFKETFLIFYEHCTICKDLEYNDVLDDIIDDLNQQICEITGHPIDGGHQIGGFPFSLQTPVFYLWALKDIIGHSNIEPSKEQHNDIMERSKKYHLLLQLSFGDPNCGFYRYGGNGFAYFGIEKRYLLDMKFKASKLVCQNT